MNRVARASSSIILSGTCLVGSLGVGSTSANGGIIVNEVVKKDENAVQAIKRVIKDLEQNGEAALGSANIVLNSLKNRLSISLMEVYSWFLNVLGLRSSDELSDLNSYLYSQNKLDSVNEIVKKVGVVQEIIDDQELSGEEKVLKVQEGLDDVLKAILGINITDIVVNDVNIAHYEAYIRDNDGKALGGILTKYDDARIERNKKKGSFLNFSFSNENMFLNAQELTCDYSNPILHVDGLSEQEERLALGSVMLLNVLLGQEISQVRRFVTHGSGVDSVRTMDVMKKFRAGWIKEDMQRLCITIICVNNILNLADSLKNKGKLSENQIKEFKKLSNTYDTIVKYWRERLKNILNNRYNEEEIGYAFEELKPDNFTNNNYKEEQKKDDSVFSELENKLNGLIGKDLVLAFNNNQI